jgi:hypothetical protein
MQISWRLLRLLLGQAFFGRVGTLTYSAYHVTVLFQLSTFSLILLDLSFGTGSPQLDPQDLTLSTGSYSKLTALWMNLSSTSM